MKNDKEWLFKKGQVAWNKGSGGCKRGHDPSLYTKLPSGIFVCLACKRENGAKYREKNKNKKAYIIRRRVERYDLTPEGFNKILEYQINLCPICGIKLNLDNCRIDHCHKSGYVRGILCVSCNTGIGLLKDSTEIMNNAINYIKDNGKTIRSNITKTP